MDGIGISGEATNVSRMRSFDPRKVGSLECRAWYRRRWAAFLIALPTPPAR